MSRREYTNEERAACLAALHANGGNVAKTARECGVPRMTLQHWAGLTNGDEDASSSEKEPAVPSSSPPRPCGLTELVEIAKATLAEKFDAMAHKFLGVADGKADDLNAKDAMVAAGIAVDKMRLLRNEPTAITRHQQDAEALRKLPPEELIRAYREALATCPN